MIRLMIGLLALGMPATAWAYGSGGEEDRCAELGSYCQCSEPLNNNDNLPAAPDRHHNPSDTTNTALECDGERGSGRFLTMPADYSESRMVRANDAGRPFPSGANPYIYQGKLGGIHHGYFDGFSDSSQFANISNETVCVRAYRRYDNGVRMSSSSNRIKNIQMGRWSPAAHANIEHNWDGNSAFVTVVDGMYGLDGSQYDGGFQQKCSDGGWCRVEVCADLSGTSLTYRYHITSLTTGEEKKYVWGPGSGPSTTYFSLPAMHMFVQGSIPGAQYASHAMQARVPHDPSFVIGAAYELEGGESGPPPPDPGPDPDPAPPFGAVMSELREPDRDAAGQMLQSLQGCEIERTFKGEALDPLRFTATSTAGGGLYEGIDLLEGYPDLCGGVLTVRSDCMNDPGRGPQSPDMDFILGPCSEDVPQAPVQVR